MIPAVSRWDALSGGRGLTAEHRVFSEGMIRLEAGVRSVAGEKTAVTLRHQQPVRHGPRPTNEQTLERAT